MDKMIEMGILFDYYGKLLTDRQYDTVELYYSYDLSLTEIAKELGISKQSVSDTLKRAEIKLNEYEKVLQLAARDIYKDKIFKYIYSLANEIEFSNSLIKNKEQAKLIKKHIDNMIKTNQEVM